VPEKEEEEEGQEKKDLIKSRDPHGRWRNKTLGDSFTPYVW